MGVTHPDTSGIALLFVEDEKEVREMIGAAIVADYPGIDLKVAENGAEALELFRVHRPDLVLTDIHMPVVDGITMAAEIRKEDPDVTIIAITAYSDAACLLQAIEVGFNQYLLKPLNYDRLFAGIDSAIEAINLKRRVTAQHEELRLFASRLEQRVEERTRELVASRLEVENQNARLRKLTRELKLSRDRYWNLYNWSPLGYLTIDEQCVIREINITGARLLGAKRSELVGTSIEAFISAENLRLLLDSIKRCIEESHATAELQMQVRDGKYLYVQLHCVPYRHWRTDERVYRTGLIDISRMKQAEDRLCRLNRLYSVLSRTGKAIVQAADREELFSEICRIAVDQGGFVQACIGMLNETTGLVEPVATTGAGGESCTCFLADLRGPGPVAVALRGNGYYISNDRRGDPNVAFLCHEGSRRDFGSMAAFALRMNGAPVGALNFTAREVDFFGPDMIELLVQMATDVSFALENRELARRRSEAEEHLKRETMEKLAAIEELRRKEQLLLQQSRQAAMGEMLANIAHHWRQPLNVIGLIVQELGILQEQGPLSRETLAASTEKAMQVVLQMSHTIDDFMNYFRSDDQLEKFSVNDIVTRTISLLAASFRGVEPQIDLVADEEILIEGYPGEYSQVLLNILMNARDAFVERGVDAPRVVIRLFREGEKAVMTVTDNAGGIAADVMERMFEPYFTTKGPDKGTGIGLFMAKTIIEKNMNGRLTVRSLETGAEFRIEV